MTIAGPIALIAAIGIAGWLLFRLAQGGGVGGEARNITILKGVVWLGLAAALFAAKLAPLAFMVLLAAGRVTAIEVWREREIKRTSEDGSQARAFPPDEKKLNGRLTADEAASILGLTLSAEKAEIREAHRRLIGQLHPDKGGSDYLAAKINDAREVMLALATDRETIADNSEPESPIDPKSADPKAADDLTE